VWLKFLWLARIHVSESKVKCDLSGIIPGQMRSLQAILSIAGNAATRHHQTHQSHNNRSGTEANTRQYA
jgi:hypothetical protein